MFFGVGGGLIATCSATVLLYLGRIRSRVTAHWIAPIDLVAWAVVCFAAAAWNLCGSAAMPGHLLFPEPLAELANLPFAIGQMKTVMALLAAGWVLLLLAAAKFHSELDATDSPASR